MILMVLKFKLMNSLDYYDANPRFVWTAFVVISPKPKD